LNGLKWATLITAGLSLFFAAAPGVTGSFSSPYDLRMQLPDWLIEAAVSDRKAALSSDAFRSFIFIALAAGILYLWHLKKIKTNIFIGILGLLILIDLWAVDKRYLNDDNFISKREATNPFPEMPADKAILQDKDLSYRVLPLQNPFQDARTSYYHKNVGGYHAAKLRRYQDVIEHNLAPEMQMMIRGLQSGSSIDSIFMQTPVINMLNTRYIIYDLNQPPLTNPRPLGNAWFVENYSIVENADEEIAALRRNNPSINAIIDERFEEFVEGKKFNIDLNGTIELTEYQPNYLKYKTKAATEQLTVFSEIYYNKGWDAYVDGEKVPHFRVDYILRAIILPAGEHTVEFKFAPKSYFIGNNISLASSILLMLAIVGYGFNEFRKKWKKEIK
ncbi:MAG: YfhO family protein, partial [Draconibacterium sp.]|nr:YfhO family protein [Draconibacterium sp.]